MEDIKIYLSGGMTGLAPDIQRKWRARVINAIKYGDFEISKNVSFYNPPDYFNFEEKRYKTEREVFEFDIYNLKKSDIVIVNFNSPNSIGTAMELAIAKEHNIPVIGLNADKVELHPWLVQCCTRICDDLRELVSYVVDFYIN